MFLLVPMALCVIHTLILSTHDARLICDQVSLSFILLFLDTPMRKICTVALVYFTLIEYPDDSLE